MEQDRPGVIAVVGLVIGGWAFRIITAFLTVPFALVLLEFGVVRREESYLARKCGDQYRDDRSHVRRWI